MKNWLLIVFVCLSLPMLAQEKNIRKARTQYESERYEKALTLIEKALKHKDTKNDPEALILHAKILVAIGYENPEHPKALFDALKSAEKALVKVKSSDDFKAREMPFYLSLRDICMEAGYNELENKRYIQADKYFSKVYDLYFWMPARWAQARVALALNDTATAVFISRELVTQLVLTDSVSAKLGDAGPFLLVIDDHIKRKNYDSASYYAEFAADHYPESVLVKNKLLKSFLLLVTSNKPELQTLELFAEMRPRFKNDSLFISKENVLFLYLMNKYSAGDENHISDSLLAGFIQVKNDYYSEFGEDYRRKDPMFNPDNNELIFNLIRYTARFERTYMLAMLLGNYVSGNYANEEFQASTRAGRWKNLFERVKQEHSVFLLASALTAATEELKKESWFAPYKKELLLNALNSPGQFKDRTALYNFVPFILEEYPSDKVIYQKTEQLSLGIIDEFTDSAWFSYARISIRQHDRFFPQSDKVRELKKAFVIRDYKENYFGSRLLKTEANGVLVPEWVWKGNESLCDAGEVPAFIHAKVEQRINYFRRAAGVPDYVRLDTIKNEACQKAALIYQVNTGKMFTEPAETWKCYTISSVEAAQLSARVFGQTTVFAVTSIMADQGDENSSVGNRRWMLYPPARNMGHGSTNKVALIWTLNDEGDKDTTEYLEDFVSWPPRDYCPIMFAFPRWHFSLYADLSKAKVTVSMDGNPLSITQEKQVPGYGMPSLVWLNNFEPEQGKTYTVTVSGIQRHGEKDLSTYSYTVEFIDPMK
ncbi:MAG: tetratricopeptide repeat protein [Bacteroidia bacterium]